MKYGQGKKRGPRLCNDVANICFGGLLSSILRCFTCPQVLVLALAGVAQWIECR